MNLPDPEKILKGEVIYTLEDFFNELRAGWMNAGFDKSLSDERKEEAFRSLFMFILLSGEDKPMSVMTDLYKLEENKKKEMQDAFKDEIEVVRHIHMKKYLELLKEYQGGMDMTLKLLNLWIQDFLKIHIKEDTNGST
ncbi:MAG TPA: hypothetical protein VK338_00740 [Candidatus Nitrosocosmicus sp.]|nr:hypothetical protein [Candidatus Nitrosocosmicus sp.]